MEQSTESLQEVNAIAFMYQSQWMRFIQWR
jgi:hypothetical protein